MKPVVNSFNLVELIKVKYLLDKPLSLADVKNKELLIAKEVARDIIQTIEENSEIYNQTRA